MRIILNDTSPNGVDNFLDEFLDKFYSVETNIVADEKTNDKIQYYNINKRKKVIIRKYTKDTNQLIEILFGALSSNKDMLVISSNLLREDFNKISMQYETSEEEATSEEQYKKNPILFMLTVGNSPVFIVK